MKIKIYEDYLYNKAALAARLKDAAPGVDILTIDAAGIMRGGLDDCSMFIMPGGADLNFCEKLNGTPNRLVRAYVEKGGAYLGLCAGAYYAAQDIAWAVHEGDAAITGPRELAFTAFTAAGPIYSYVQDGDFYKSWDGLCRLEEAENRFPAVYRGGCFFQGQDAGAEILARYDDIEDRPPAVIYKKIGRGRVILSGPHIELNAVAYKNGLYKNANDAFDYQEKIANQLSGTDAGVNDFWRRVVLKLL